MLLIRTTISQENFPSKRAWDRARTRAHADQGSHWHQHLLPKHFQPDAKTRYQHKPRTEKYIKRKKRLAKIGKVKYGGEVDNVATGFMERILTSSASIRAYPSRVTVGMPGPRYINMRPHKSNQPDKAAEIIRVTDAEAKELEKVLDDSLIRSIDKERSKGIIS